MRKNKLIAGLGNFGEKYNKTRHNVGFWLLDELAKFHNTQWQQSLKFKADIASIDSENGNIYLIKPRQFMNNNGISIASIISFYKIEPQNIIVAHDELDLPSGTIKLKKGGGNGGHNGLKNIFEHFGNKDFWRLRIGISHPGDKSAVTNYVLSKPDKNQATAITDKISDVIDQNDLLINEEFDKFMRIIH
ncbi:MAG: aminoacyl-tRNA hydrolase [Gammaproteobacteria bacterium]|nr:MAG: aminoacyl-tRNA hydrolase [Gammaproteobacteria bacterium]